MKVSKINKINKILSTNDILKKEITMAADFSMKVLDFEPNKKFQSFLSIMFDHSMISIINKLISKKLL